MYIVYAPIFTRAVGERLRELIKLIIIPASEPGHSRLPCAGRHHEKHIHCSRHSRRLQVHTPGRPLADSRGPGPAGARHHWPRHTVTVTGMFPSKP